MTFLRLIFILQTDVNQTLTYFLIAAQRRTLKERRSFIGSDANVGVQKIVDKYPFLSIMTFVSITTIL